jgi:hypothetical protein
LKALGHTELARELYRVAAERQAPGVLAIVITFDSRDRSSVVVSGEVSRERFRAHLDGAVKIISSWWRRQQQQ